MAMLSIIIDWRIPADDCVKCWAEEAAKSYRFLSARCGMSVIRSIEAPTHTVLYASLWYCCYFYFHFTDGNGDSPAQVSDLSFWNMISYIVPTPALVLFFITNILPVALCIQLSYKYPACIESPVFSLCLWYWVLQSTMNDICLYFNHQPSGWEHKFTFFTPDRYSSDQNSLPPTNDIIAQGTWHRCYDPCSLLLFIFSFLFPF